LVEIDYFGFTALTLLVGQ